MKLISRFLVIMLAISFLSMILVTMVSSTMSRKAILDEGYSKLQASVANGATYTDGWLKGQLALVNTLAVDLSEQPDLNPARLLPIVQMHTNANADVFDVYYGVPSGIVTFSSGFQPPYDQGWASYKRPWYIEAMKDVNKAVFTDLYVDVQTGDLCLTAAKAVIKNGEVIGVASSDMLIDQIKRNVATLHVEDSEFSFITNRSGGVLILSNDPTYIGDGKGNFDHLDAINEGAYDGVWQQTANGGVTEIKDTDGERKLFVCSVIGTTEWRLYSVVPFSSLTAPVNSLNVTLVVISIITLILAATVAAVMIIMMKKKLAQPLPVGESPGSGRTLTVDWEAPPKDEIHQKAKSWSEADSLGYENERIRENERIKSAVASSVRTDAATSNDIPEMTERNYKFSSLVNNVIHTLRTRILNAQIRFALNIDCAIPENLFGDDSRIRQLLLIAISNSVKYTPKGNVYLAIQGKIVDNNTIMLKLVVMDTGKGIRQEDLAVLRNLIRAMGGDINMESESGTENIMTLTLPQRYTAGDKLASVNNAQEKSILVYERRELYAISVMFALENLGVKCMRVSGGAEFSEMISRHRFSFVFIAARLYETHKESLSSLGAYTRIVLLTEPDDVIRDKSLGVLVMPVYSLPIAVLLNQEPEHTLYAAGRNMGQKKPNAVIPVASAAEEKREEKKVAEDKAAADRETLKAELNKLKLALYDLDFAVIYDRINGLREYTKAEMVGNDVDRVLQNMLSGDYDVAEALIDALLKKL